MSIVKGRWSWLTEIIGFGVDDSLQPEDVRYVQLVNVAGVLGVFTNLINIPWFLYFLPHTKWLAISMLGVGVLLVGVPLINRKKYHNLARILLSLLVATQIVVSSLLVGSAAHYHIFLVLIILGGFLGTPARVFKWLPVFILIYGCLFVALIKTDFQLLEMPTHVIELIANINIVFFLVDVVALSVYSTTIYRKYERDLRSERQKTIDQAQELARTVENLKEEVAVRTRTEADLQQSNTELGDLNRELVALQHERDRFVAMISHELRTPLVTGLGYLQMLLNGQLGIIPELARDKMRVSMRNLKKLSTQIDDILRYYRLASGSIPWSRRTTETNIGLLLEECIEDLVVWSERNEDSVSIDLDSELRQARLFVDEELLRAVFANLLQNAHRHGGAECAIRLKARMVRPGQVRFAVEDNGVGIPEELKGSLCQPYVSHTRLGTGIGLGLAIVKGILEALGADLEIESNQGEGTRISFELPLNLQS